MIIIKHFFLSNEEERINICEKKRCKWIGIIKIEITLHNQVLPPADYKILEKCLRNNKRKTLGKGGRSTPSAFGGDREKSNLTSGGTLGQLPPLSRKA